MSENRVRVALLKNGGEQQETANGGLSNLGFVSRARRANVVASWQLLHQKLQRT